MPESHKNATTLQVMRTRVSQRLQRVWKRVRFQFVLQGVNSCCWIALLFCVISFIVDWKMELALPTRVTFSLLGFACLSVQVIRRIYVAYTSQWTLFDIASSLDRMRPPSTPEILPRVATLFQMPDVFDSQSSRELIQESARQSFWLLDKIRFEDRVGRRSLRLCWAGIVTSIALLGLACLATPSGAPTIWLERWLGAKNSAWPRNTQIVLQGAEKGKLIVIRGEPFDIHVYANQKKGEPSSQLRIDLRIDSINRETQYVSDSSGRFSARLGPIYESGTIQLQAGDARIGPIDLRPMDRPNLVGVEIQTKHPWDDESSTRDLLQGDRPLHLLPSTSAKLTVTADVPLADLRLTDASKQIQEDEDHISIDRASEDSFAANWRHNSELLLRVEAIGRSGGIASLPRTFRIGLTRDQPPVVQLSCQGLGQRVTTLATIPLRLKARDDFGIDQIRLETAVTETGPTNSIQTEKDSVNDAPTFRKVQPSPVAIEGDEPKRIKVVETDFKLSLADKKLPLGSRFYAKAVVADNCYSQKQETESKLVSFQIVAPEELFREILLRQQELRKRLQVEYERASDQKIAIHSADLAKDRKRLLRLHRSNSAGVKAVYLGLAQSKQELDWNQLGGDETIRLIEKNLLEPMMGLLENEMARQQALLNQNAREQVSKEQTIRQQQNIIERLGEILKNMSQWDNFAEVVNQLDAVIKMQETLQRQTEELNDSEIESVFE